MTIPYMMNCEHSPEGWCLDCLMKNHVPFHQLMTTELRRARELHPSTFVNAHKSLGVMLGEFHDLQAEVFLAEYFCKESKRDNAAILAKLVQVAAMCQRTAEDLGMLGGDEDSVHREHLRTDEDNWKSIGSH